jgi:hypothetical protein
LGLIGDGAPIYERPKTSRKLNSDKISSPTKSFVQTNGNKDLSEVADL